MIPDPSWGEDYQRGEGYWFQRVTREIVPDKETHYGGELYILTSGYTASAAVSFAAFARDQGRATIIGQEGRSGYHHMNAIDYLSVRLGETGITLRIPLIKIVTDRPKNSGIPYGRGVIPDIEVSHSSLNLTQGNDPEIQTALKIIQDRQRRRHTIRWLVFLILGVLLIVVLYKAGVLSGTALVRHATTNRKQHMRAKYRGKKRDDLLH